ncbi:hypothetical protein DFQ27_001874 [Actinomortierella ambigua]|uniref:Lysozyme n=1 Tax=Actinomortierella ambigua TaxID=1343610 RepID=A0A9P6U7U8_9FUNG|nr:hypothetical protein DFQ27_001874 [Actinomortierella ambigua]
MKFTFVIATAAAILGVTNAAACKGLNTAGINLIKEFEGFVARPKPDPIGLPTVGYGHLCQKRNCAEVKYKFPLTRATATALLKDDIPKYTKCIENALNARVKLNKNQWAALTSWTFNVGCGAMKGSTLVRRLNAGQNPNTVAAQELPKWKYAGGRVLPGLVRRRNAEIKLFRTAIKSAAHPNCA